jgi:hypothetical protein
MEFRNTRAFLVALPVLSITNTFLLGLAGRFVNLKQDDLPTSDILRK